MTTIPSAALRDLYLNQIETEAPITRKVLQAIPQTDWNYQPSAKSMKFGELAWHMVQTESWFSRAIDKGAFHEGLLSDLPKTVSSTQELLNLQETLTMASIEKMRRWSDATLAKEIDFYGMIKLRAVEFMGWCLNHSIHHRGQLAVYLRLVGAKVPGIYGPSADEPMM